MLSALLQQREKEKKARLQIAREACEAVRENRLIALALLVNLTMVKEYHNVLMSPTCQHTVLSTLFNLLDEYVESPVLPPQAGSLPTTDCETSPTFIPDQQSCSVELGGSAIDMKGLTGRVVEHDAATGEPLVQHFALMTLCNLTMNTQNHESIQQAVSVPLMLPKTEFLKKLILCLTEWLYSPAPICACFVSNAFDTQFREHLAHRWWFDSILTSLKLESSTVSNVCFTTLIVTFAQDSWLSDAVVDTSAPQPADVSILKVD